MTINVAAAFSMKNNRRHDLVTFPRDTFVEPPLIPSPRVLSHLISSHRVSSHRFAYGDNRIRTGDPLLAKQVLYQLSYVPLN
jgi:hypothetical protein